MLASIGEAVGRFHQESTSSSNALGAAVGRFHLESTSSLVALGEAVGHQRQESTSTLSALGVNLRFEMQQLTEKLNEKLNGFVGEQRTWERLLMHHQNELARLNFALGKKGNPADIVLGDLDTYDRLDQNWLSFRDTSGKQLSTTTIEGDRSRTAVIIVLGQSNAANHGTGHYVAKHRVDNFSLYDGCCYHAADPLLGASGDEGNFATRLGDKLIEAGLFDRIILAPIAMGGTTVEQWADEGMFNRRILALIRRLHDAGLSTDFILWHQGEGNPGMGDAHGRQYRKNLLEVVNTFRRYGIDAPFFVALVTRCGDAPHPNAVNIRDGQKGAVDPMAGVYLGPDTDTIGVEHRWDKCHFDESGLDLAASLWLQCLAESNCTAGGSAPAHAVRLGPTVSAPRPRIERQRPGFSGAPLPQIAAAFAVEMKFKPVTGSVLLVNERMSPVTVAANEVASRLTAADPTQGALTGSGPVDFVVAWEGVRHAFHPRAALTSICNLLVPGGRLVYAQRLDGHYLGLTPKWLLDYFVESRYADCRVYLLWPPQETPAVATFDYHWMLDHAGPVYNPMWDNITNASAVLVVAEKAADSAPGLPSQDIYRLQNEWDRYVEGLSKMVTSTRPFHLAGRPPERLPPGYKLVG